MDGDIRLAKPSKDFLEGLLCIEMEEGKRKKQAENACLFSFFLCLNAGEMRSEWYHDDQKGIE